MKFKDFSLNLLAGFYGGLIVFALTMFQQRFYPNPSYQEFLFMTAIPILLIFAFIRFGGKYLFNK